MCSLSSSCYGNCRVLLAAWPGRGRCRASCQVMHDANVTHIRRRSFAHSHGLRARRTGCGCGPWPEPGGLPGPPASVAGGGPGGRWRCNAIAGSLQRIGAAPDTGRACRTGRHDRGERCWRPAALSSAQRRLANQQRSCLWAGLSAVRPATVFSGAGSLLAAVFWQSFCVLGVVCRRTVRKPGSAKAVKGKRDTRKKGGRQKGIPCLCLPVSARSLRMPRVACGDAGSSLSVSLPGGFTR